MNTVNELNMELCVMKKQCEEFDAENQRLTETLEKRSIEMSSEQTGQSIGKLSLS